MASDKQVKRDGNRHGRTVPGVDPSLVGEPIETEEGLRTPVQQNVGYGVEEGGGEWPDPNTPPRPPAPGAADRPDR